MPVTVSWGRQTLQGARRRGGTVQKAVEIPGLPRNDSGFRADGNEPGEALPKCRRKNRGRASGTESLQAQGHSSALRGREAPVVYGNLSRELWNELFPLTEFPIITASMFLKTGTWTRGRSALWFGAIDSLWQGLSYFVLDYNTQWGVPFLSQIYDTHRYLKPK